MAVPETPFETALGLLHHKIQQPITSREWFLAYPSLHLYKPFIA